MPASIKLSAVFPQPEIGTDPEDIVRFAKTVEDLGYEHLIAYDHVVGANPASRPGVPLPYTHKDMFHEPMVLFSFLAPVTRNIIFSTGVVVLPQRQIALFAKQAANLDLFCRGRLRLGVGIGWNAVEYEALGVPFEKRGARFDDQLRLLRRLWTEELVTEHTPFHDITDAGLNPLPLQRPIPLWLGGNSDAARRRAARTGDGWLPYIMKENNGPAGLSFDHVRDTLAIFRDEVAAAGRNPESVGVETIIFLRPLPDGTPRTVDDIVQEIGELQDMGLSGVGIDTQLAGLWGADAHLEIFHAVKDKLKS